MPVLLSKARRALWGAILACAAGGAVVGCGGGDGSGEGSGDLTLGLLAHDDFTQGLGRWKVEQQDGAGTVTASGGVLDIVQPSGATIWFRQKFSGDYQITFSATPVPITFPDTRFFDRISDLNMFWNAVDPRASGGDPTLNTFDGALNSYNPVKLYYVGFGANSNTTTRLRRNDGTDSRPQITGYSTPASATADDRAGGMTAATTLVANQPTQVRIVSRAPTAGDPVTLRWYANGALVFSHTDPAAYLEGWFALRTTTSHWQIRDFKVQALAQL
ncbi:MULTISPECIES: DUF6250 domain-containing protein [unclassified Acidovorax]|uniref:DUF6250 domain-containing protein n=1 Tax=unclassified Acidovorax TaxID=2684926 RepID=UPI0028832C9A|nr:MULTISPECIES: DUF6250 domain-containing protein [unclassified Acidovorax]